MAPGISFNASACSSSSLKKTIYLTLLRFASFRAFAPATYTPQRHSHLKIDAKYLGEGRVTCKIDCSRAKATNSEMASPIPSEIQNEQVSRY